MIDSLPRRRIDTAPGSIRSWGPLCGPPVVASPHSGPYRQASWDRLRPELGRQPCKSRLRGSIAIHDGTAAPRAEYQQRRDARRAVADRLERRSARIADARLGAFVAGLAVAAASALGRLVLGLVAGRAGGRPVRPGDRQRRRRPPRATGRRQQLLLRGGARSARRPLGRQGRRRIERFRSPITRSTPTSTSSAPARSSSGSAPPGPGPARRPWPLAAPARPVRTRSAAGKAAVEELRGRLDLREDIALLGDDVERGAPPGRPDRLGRGPAGPLGGRGCRSRHRRLAVAQRGDARRLGLPAGSAASRSWSTVAATLGFNRLVQATPRPGDIGDRRAGRRAPGARRSCWRRIEREPFDAPRLRAIRDAMASGGEEPSRRIARLARFATLLDFRRNQLFAPIAFLVLWQRPSRRSPSSAGGAAPGTDRRLARCGRPVRGALRPRLLRLRDARRPVPRRSSTKAAAPSSRPTAPGASADPPRPVRPQRPGDRGTGSAAGPAGQRLEHVGQEHAAAVDRRQRRAGDGRGAGPGGIADRSRR